METIEILKEQIAELEKLVQLKNQRIQELELMAAKPIKIDSPIPLIPYVTPYMAPSNPCVLGHIYPQGPHQGILPPVCQRCGQPAWAYQVTCQINQGVIGIGGTSHPPTQTFYGTQDFSHYGSGGSCGGHLKLVVPGDNN